MAEVAEVAEEQEGGVNVSTSRENELKKPLQHFEGKAIRAENPIAVTKAAQAAAAAAALINGLRDTNASLIRSQLSYQKLLINWRYYYYI